jgi:hypothetical protein
MDDDTLSVLKTVCVAGQARPGFNDESNARLDQLVEEGFLRVVQASSAGSKVSVPRRYYKPTEKGQAMYKQLIGAA